MDDSAKEILFRIRQYLDVTPEAIGIYVEEFNIRETHSLSPNQKYWHTNQIELYTIEVALNTLIRYLQNIEMDTRRYDMISHCNYTTAR
uniref:AraC family transcriptional regulator n=1 Tax=Strongyloides venezuelensis TaxID=75913 RepID=A0A0K0FHH3_STRVS